MTSRALSIIMVLLIALSCSTDDEMAPLRPNIFTDPAEFYASLIVEVVNENGQPIQDASVLLGNEMSTTNADGLAYLPEVAMSSSSYVVVEHDQYFHGSRRFYPSRGALQNIKVILLESNLSTIFDNRTGGDVKIDNNLSLRFEPLSVSLQDGSDYEGIVGVRAKSLRADNPDLTEMMPGDLVGRTTDGEYTGLETFGMMVVELVGENGESLQVAEGSSVEFTLAVPDQLRTIAPSTIPLWFFDEVSGFWEEDGKAALAEEGYVGEVSHFTFWNCDLPYDAVKWGASFVYEGGAVETPLKVCLTIVESGRTFCSTTNSDGVVCGLVSSSSELYMEVTNSCGVSLYSSTIGPFFDSTMIGPITIPEQSSGITTITGSAVNCSNEPVAEGMVCVNYGRGNQYFLLGQEGNFTIDIPTACVQGAIEVQVWSRQLITSDKIIVPSGAVVDLGSIRVCSEPVGEFLILDYGDDVSVVWTENVGAGAVIDQLLWEIAAFEGDSTSIANRIIFRLDQVADGGFHPDQEVELVFLNNAEVISASGVADVSFDEFGLSLNDVISGAFEGQVVQARDSIMVEITGSFRLILGE